MAKSQAGIFFTTLLALLGPGLSTAQVIQVDTAPQDAVNHFDPQKALGGGIDRIAKQAIDKTLTPATVKRVVSAGWQPVTYRLNTELSQEAWHWNPTGTWSQPNGRGYFTGSAKPGQFIRYSYGYKLPRGSASLTDGDASNFWKSNPYLTSRFTGEPDSQHPQWVMMDLAELRDIDSIRIDWAAPFATHYTVQFWSGTADPKTYPLAGKWEPFPHGHVKDGNGGNATLRLSDTPRSVRYIRILMTESSNTCDQDGPSDPRNCVGYAIHELSLGTATPDGKFHDLVRHIADPERTHARASSVDPWHTANDKPLAASAQPGFDLFYKSGVTQGLPAIMPIAVVYDNPDNAVAEIEYLKARNYPVSYLELGEEMDGQAMSPEDYAALYLQFATALHTVDPTLKLGGPSFEGVNKDILYWPDAKNDASWTRRFLNYLKAHDRMNDLAFFSFEHYPYEPCHISWGSLYDEPALVHGIMQIWREDGLPPNVPMLITESNLSSDAEESFMDIFGGLWLADYIGSFLNEGGSGVYFFHETPLQMTSDCNHSPGNFGMFSLAADYQIKQPLSQYFASRMINFEWLQRKGIHTMYPSTGTYQDGAGHALVTSYSVQRPDGAWSVMMVNRDQENAHAVQINFHNKSAGTDTHFSGDVQTALFGSEQYKWHPARANGSEAHYPMSMDEASGLYIPGFAKPDGPIQETTQHADEATSFNIPAASILVVRGSVIPQGKPAQ